MFEKHDRLNLNSLLLDDDLFEYSQKLKKWLSKMQKNSRSCNNSKDTQELSQDIFLDIIIKINKGIKI